jgi:hypothetical protein
MVKVDAVRALARDAMHDFGARVVSPPNNSPTTGGSYETVAEGISGWVIRPPIEDDKTEACNCP